MKHLIIIFVFVTVSRADLDPQEITDIACETYYEFTTDTGIIESPGYPDPYPNYAICLWSINPSAGVPDGQGIFLEIHSFSTENGYDELLIYEGEGTIGQKLWTLDGDYDAGLYLALGSNEVTLSFHSDSSAQDFGFRLEYYIGERSPGQEFASIACDEDTSPAIINNVSSSIIETIGYPLSHNEYTTCEWTIHVPDAVQGLYLNVIDFDTAAELNIYFAEDSGGDRDARWAGTLSPGHSLYNPGSVMTLLYDSRYSYTGFQLFYYPADGACTSGAGNVIDVSDNGEIRSPGYPYNVPEHLSCRWLLRAPEGQKLVLTAVDQSLYGDGINCADEYVEILDGDTTSALSLGKFCGNVTFGAIPSTGNSLQVYFRTHEDSRTSGELPTGFAYSYQAV